LSTRTHIPKSALEHHIAFVGKTGSAKTGSVKSSIVEPELAAKERVCVIDPTGAWWGLRLAADGKSKGLPIYVFGGDHGDYPLLGTQGEMMAEAIGGSNTPAILDTTKMKTGERMRFFTDFADTILRANQGPLRLVIDECHLFAPQAGTRGSGLMPDMLHAANNLISLGRSRGLRIVLISQRPAKVHKDSLTQVETLVAMRLIAPQDRKAVEEWIADQADKDTGKEIISSLPGLKNGEGWVWSPEANFLNRVVFPMPKTYDSSKVQNTGKAAKRLSPIDLEKLQDKFAKVKTEAEAKDPKALQKRIAELEAAAKKTPAIDPKAVEEAEKRGFEQARKKLTAEMEREVQKRTADLLSGLGERIGPLMAYLNEQAKPAKAQKTPLGIEFAPTAAPAPAAAPRAPIPPRRPAPAGNGEADIGGSEQRVLDAIRWWNVLGIAAPSHAQTAFIARYSHKSGTWSTYLGRLRSKGLIEGRGDLVLTAEGATLAAEPATPPTREALHAAVLEKIDTPLQRILSPLLNAYPEGLSHPDAAGMAGYSHQSGTWSTYLSRLRSLDLIAGRGELKAEDWLFAA
jgi:hypothetical protein